MPPKTRLVRKPSKAMDTFLKTGNQAGRLLPSLERFLMTEEPEFRSQAVLHPSAMAKSDWCPRSGYYQLLFDDTGRTPPGERNALQRQNIFDEGHYIHDKWQQRFWRQGVLYGKYTCISCMHSWWATSPQFCNNIACQAMRKFLRYSEITLHSPDEYRIGGHSDGWVKDSRGDCMIEIKSVGKGTYRFEAPNMVARYGEDTEALWKNTRRPFSSHVRQLQIYMHLARLAFGDESPTEGVFIYESKMNQQYKEFVIEYDPEETKGIFRDAKDIVRRLRSETPEPPECFYGDKGCKECKPYEVLAA